MRHSSIRLPAVMVLLAGLLAGCATPPSTQIQQPMTARPAPRPVVTENNGAIYQPRQGLALFEDRRARNVGDTLTVNLVESMSATRSTETGKSRSASASIAVTQPTVLGWRVPLPGTSWDPSASSSLEVKDDDTNSNTIKGSVTVTVVDVLDNGNLMVAGEKQITVNNDTEYIRLAGVVNPMHITAKNTVDSTQVADVQIESKNSMGLDKSQLTSMLARFFLTVLPF